MNAIVDNHEAPMVISSVMKQNCTERGRRIVECGMDIAAGSAICRGDKNYMGNAYMSLPIAITVEGANIMTRSFQIIGQGLTRCHPHMSDLLKALQLPPSQEKEGVKTFVAQFHKIVGHGISTSLDQFPRVLLLPCLPRSDPRRPTRVEMICSTTTRSNSYVYPTTLP